uniref:Uncharacterized protein n=1 Tax=Medicago truncatula TaxID=3880 RepID=I3STD2_MEDTR|nr:unknown [Medicago truncatula]
MIFVSAFRLVGMLQPEALLDSFFHGILQHWPVVCSLGVLYYSSAPLA